MDYEQFNAAPPPVDHWVGSAENAQQGDARGHEGRVTSLVKLVKTIAAAVLLSAGILMVPGTAAAGQSPADFIRVLGTQGLDVIRSNMTLNDKAAYFRQLLRQDFDLTGICRFVLGPYWRIASAGQRREFRRLFEDHLMRFYGEQFAQYGGESLRVTGNRIDPATVVVTSQILRPQGPSIEVDWRLGVKDGLYKITDVAVDGVSMVLTQRSEFASVIERSGGQVAVLLATMRE
jgi:phospholipid transport system substrate-binding protein